MLETQCQDKQCLVNQIGHVAKRVDLDLQIFQRLDLHFSRKAQNKARN